MPAGAIIAVALVLTAVVGLIVGAIWGQTGGRGASSSASGVPSAVVTPSTPGPTSPSAADSTASSAPPTASAPSVPASPAASPTGTAPPAPATTTTSADGWRLGSWQVTNSGGTLGIDTTARNTATGTRSATLVLYVYVGGTLIATTTAAVTDVPAGGTVPVHFAGSDPWQPGTKILLLATA